MNDIVPIVIEEEVDQHIIEPVQPQEAVIPVVVLGLQAQSPENWLVEEIPEDMLMDDAELNADNIEANQEGDPNHQQQQPQNNIQLGMVEILDAHAMDPGLAHFLSQREC